MQVSRIQSEVYSGVYYQKKEKCIVPSFGIANAGKLKELFAYNLPCMYTGVEMIDSRKVQKFINSKAFNAPAAQVLQLIKPFEKSITGIEAEVYSDIKQTAQYFPDKDLQQILKILAPDYKKILKNEQRPVLQKISETAKELPEEYKYRFQHFMSETEDKINEKPIFIPFSSYEFKYKLDKIREDISQNASHKAIKVIDKLVLEASRLTNKTDNKTLETQKQIMKFLKIILKTSILKKNTQLQGLINDSQKRLNNESYVIPFSRKTFIYDLKNLLEPFENKELKDKLISLAIELPSSKDSKSAYITKFSREPSWKIAYRLLWPNLASVEHILPQSKGGKDEMSNFGGAGARVNAERGNIDFTEQIKIVPQTVVNSQKYVDALTSLVKKGIFVKTGNSTYYIDSFAKTIKEQSKGQIELNTAEIEQYRFKGSILMDILAKLSGK